MDSQGKLLAAAENRIAEARRRQAGLAIEIQSVVTGIEHDAVAEVAHIGKDATGGVARINRQSRDAITMETKAAEASAKRAFIDDLIAKAEKKISDRITPETDRLLRAGSVKQGSVVLQ